VIQVGEPAPEFSLYKPQGRPTLVVFLETDCPTCRLTIPYLNRLAQDSGQVIGVSQDSEGATREMLAGLSVVFPVAVDLDLSLSRAYDPEAVPAMILVDGEGRVRRAQIGFDKEELNAIALEMGLGPVAGAYDGAPPSKPGCVSRHREPAAAGEPAPECATTSVPLDRPRGARASRVVLAEDADPYEYCQRAFADPLPVVPPTVERVERLLRAAALDPQEVIGRIPPCYGEATVEKIAANAVMAGCAPEMMRVLIPLVRAVCDERFNAHGVQATTHFAAPLIVVSGPVRAELGFASGQNVFSNVARANSTLGRALQLILLNLGGARPDGIDMSTLGNPGKFSYCIAENEEESPWEPLHVERGFQREQSAVTLFAAEPPRGVSEHSARSGRGVLRTITRALATVFSYRVCMGWEAMVILCPEHARTLERDGVSKQEAREFLFAYTGIPVRYYQGEPGEGLQNAHQYREIIIDGQPCFQKFRGPEAIQLVVAGGRAGKFSAVLGSWASGPRGSQMVTYLV